MTTNQGHYSVEDVTAQVEAVISEPWYWFPVRHHSAAVADHLQATILARKPKLILIEGPSQANGLIPHLADRKSRPPVAIYSSFEDTTNQFGLAGIASATPDTPPRWACWYPQVDYSPELVAIRCAKKVNAEVRFMDLPHYARLGIEAERRKAEPEQTPDQSDDDTRNWLTERLIAESSFYRNLAAAGGYRSWEEGWDALFEFRDVQNTEEFRKELLAFCAAARATTPLERLQWDGTLDRERYMLATISDAIAETSVPPEQIMIVCGGMHCFLDRDDNTPAPAIPDGTVYNTLVPYSYFRISDLSGYGAGNRAPRYYEMNWEHRQGKLPNLNGQFVVRVLQRARKLGDKLSAADAISVSQHARMLAALRGRARPLLDDLRDAIFTCCCKGDPARHGRRLQQALDLEAIGNRVGTVTDKVDRLPLVEDFHAQLENLGLGKLATREKRNKRILDKRNEDEFQISSFFHRVHFIGVPFCELVGQPDSEFLSGLIFRETWATQWNPDIEAKLIERNLSGDSVEAVAINEVRGQVANQLGQAGPVCRMLVGAMQMNLPNLIAEIFDLAVTAIDEDGRFLSLAEAVAQLSVLDRYALHHELRREQIADMAERAFSRACFAMLDIVSAPDDDLPAIVRSLMTLAEIVLKTDDLTQRELFEQYVATTLDETALPLLRGALMGIMVELRLRPHEDLAQEIASFAASPQDQMVAAGDFIQGVITVSRVAVSMGATELVAAIDGLLSAADWEIFTTMLPKMRAGMESLHARHRDALAREVAIRYGLEESASSLRELNVSVEEATVISNVDRIVSEIMSKWSFTTE